MILKIISLFLVLNIHVTLAKKGGQRPRIDESQLVNPEPVNPDIKTAEFNDDMIQGDIGSPDGSNIDYVDRNALKDEDRLWKGGIVPYVIDSSISAEMKEKIDAAIADYHKYTCIKWENREDKTGFVEFNSNRTGCYAWLGWHGYPQPINLEDPGCRTKGTVIHEMLHTLGFGHEQARNDRDTYITVHYDRIQKSKWSQYDKMGEGGYDEEDNRGFKYDFYSVMHYPDWGFAKWAGAKTITTKDEKMQAVIGQRQGFSKQDIEEVLKVYKCKDGKSELIRPRDIPKPEEIEEPWDGDCTNKLSGDVCDREVERMTETVCDRRMRQHANDEPKLFKHVCPISCGLC